MKSFFIFCLLILTFYCCEAQKLETRYYPSFHLNGRCFIICKDIDSCTLQLDVIDRKDSTKIIWSETRFVSVKYMNDIKKIFETANNLTSTKPYCLDGMYVSGVFESKDSYYEFVCHCPFKGIQYDFLKQIHKTMRKTLKDRKSKRYIRVIREYL